jgi:hypothetical protein
LIFSLQKIGRCWNRDKRYSMQRLRKEQKPAYEEWLKGIREEK